MTHDKNATLAIGFIPSFLQNWVEWVSNDAAEIRKELWFSSSTPLLQGGWARGDTYWEDQQHTIDSFSAIVVDKAISDLPPGYRAAIFWVTGLSRVAKPNRVEDRFVEAIELLEKKVRARNVVL